MNFFHESRQLRSPDDVPSRAVRSHLVPLVFLGAFIWSSLAWAGPTVVPTTEGQIGETPAAGDTIEGVRFESIRGQAGDIIMGGIFVAGGTMPPPPEFTFLADSIHGVSSPASVVSVPTDFATVSKWIPASARSRNAADDGEFAAFSFTVDGGLADTLNVRLATFDEDGQTLVDMPIAENVGTFIDPSTQRTGVAVDTQGRATVTYTEVVTMPNLQAHVKAMRVNSATGTVIDPDLLVSLSGTSPDVALLDPAGDRLIIPHTNGNIIGRTLDFTGASPNISPEFPISTTPGIFNVLPAVASDPSTGVYTVAWENLDDIPGDPVNVRARRFDASGNPIGNDFIVNTTTLGAQGQPDVAYGPNGNSVIVWAADGVGPENLNVFAQAYDAMGNPIGSEVPVNTATAGIQDRPAVGFLPEPDTQGRPQFAVVWRDVENSDGTGANGTGVSYRCFSIDGVSPPPDPQIFADGFESGDTSSWSSTQP